MRLAWLTDVHLDFLDAEKIAALGADVAARGVDGAIVTGDISVASHLGVHLSQLTARWDFPCWYVAGNHDYYGSSIATVRGAMRAFTARAPALQWLPASGVVRLSDEVSLVGVDGWADARLGDALGTPILLNDFIRIEELIQPSRERLIEVLQRLGDEEASTLGSLLGEALSASRRVIVATHIPPFRESSTHEGRVANDQWLPWMTCDAVGRVLRRLAQAHPNREITVLAGHTHDRSVTRPEPNLEVRTGAVEYGAPVVQEVLEI